MLVNAIKLLIARVTGNKREEQSEADASGIMNRIAVNIPKCGKKYRIYAKLKTTFDEVLKNHLRNEGKK